MCICTGKQQNSIGCISTRIAWIEDEGQYVVLNEPNSKHAIKPAQIIQPHQFGEDASKGTCLYLKGLPPLIPTSNYPPRMVDGKPRWGNQTDSRTKPIRPIRSAGTIAKQNLSRYRQSNGQSVEHLGCSNLYTRYS